MPNPPSPSTDGGAVSGYRPDIDGLRAIAVISVVIFHAGVSGLPGGFVGVDIFFVISGFLIGGQMFREVEAGAFSFVSFYTRRTRRILPALFVLLTMFLLLGLAIMTPEELKQLGKETVATVLGASNVLFYTGGGYFAPAADHQPLLMTWSLGVEEQFYLVFPLLMFAMARLRLPPLATICTLSAMAFAGSIVLLGIDPKATFYLLPTRSWELGLGAALAIWSRRHPNDLPARTPTEIVSVAGLLLVVAGLALYRPGIAFPGWFVAAPTLGAALLIATPHSLIGRTLLGAPVMTFVGRVSYSWYLWHWPIFYLHRLLGGRLEGLAPLTLITVSFVMAILSWRLVEQPLRRRVLPPRQALARYAVSGLILVAAGTAAYVSGGWPQRLPSQATALANAARAGKESRCLAPYGMTTLREPDHCLPPDARQRLVILGDSHASAMAPGMAKLAEASGLAFGEMTKSSCPPLDGFATDPDDRATHWAECIAFQKAAFAWLDNHPTTRTVVLAGFWSSGMTVRGEHQPPGATVALEEALVATIRHARQGGRRVVLVKDAPSFAFDPYARVVGDQIPVRALMQSWIGGLETSAANDLTAVREDPSHAMIDRIARRTGVEIWDPTKPLCRASGCRYRGAGGLYYFDFQHLTPVGADEAVRGFRP